MDAAGQAIRSFNIQDGLAIKWFQRLGGVAAIITGKSSPGVSHRANELGIRLVVQESQDKLKDLTRLLDETRISLDETAAIGDDLPDLPVMKNCGYPIAVSNAVAEIKNIARYVTNTHGGHGAVREAIEHLMRPSGLWDRVVEHYEMQARGGSGRVPMSGEPRS